ncbi:RNA polymerase sigma factor [Teredinibacter turnerae]|uniref:RNA polymerase sigma factor n=1 Tax=Teredinibacter turnerae TaxID=2426 RepID=UPI0003677356|nr:sigma factor-like helix-turn-helix DNA-binding protein [Teredinibacter turnerae]
MENIEHEAEIASSSASEPQLELYRILNSLDKYERALMILHLEGFKYDEIASILAISESNVGTKINRIRQRLIVEHR